MQVPKLLGPIVICLETKHNKSLIPLSIHWEWSVLSCPSTTKSRDISEMPCQSNIESFLFVLSKANVKTDLAPLFTDESLVKKAIQTVAWYDIIKDIPE